MCYDRDGEKEGRKVASLSVLYLWSTSDVELVSFVQTDQLNVVHVELVSLNNVVNNVVQPR